MKRSFYEMLGIAQDAGREEIDAAFGKECLRLKSVSVRGTSDAVLAHKLIREGYEILVDPDKRAVYDAKLAAEETGVELVFFPDDRASRRGLSMGMIVFLSLAVVAGLWTYRQISSKMDEVRSEHLQAVAQKQEERNKVIMVDMTAPDAAAPAAAPGGGGR